MTASTGKRSYRACLRCRQRKIRCDFDGVGEPKKTPCVSCHFSGNECILADSRRGGNFRHRRPTSTLADTETSSSMLMKPSSPEVAPLNKSHNASEPCNGSSNSEESAAEQEPGDVLAMELRNPSDALQILARSGEPLSPRQRPAQITTIQKSNTVSKPPPDVPVSSEANDSPHRESTTRAIFEDYALVKNDLLRPSLIFELLITYHHKYHPYFPIVPAYFLKPSSMERIQKSDYFLLTAILCIASRDNPQQSLTHRYCWDHTQRLLIDVLLAHPWTQTARTVEGLLLLAEWLPHIQIQETTSESPKNLFSEDRTAWSLVGLAVRQGYLQRLDQAAFRNNGINQSKEQSEQNRIIWAYIFMADRQISVRLGQSFWSRGPSLAAEFTAKDFPNLQPRPGSECEDYASLLQATMALTQILHNAHAVLYSSKERTMAMVREGNYSRYLDDFLNSATVWHSTWSDIKVSTTLKTTLMIMYEYICIYTNAFSFQAVLTRASITSTSSPKKHHSKGIFTDLFAGGIMSSPDGKYIFDAISAAMNLLGLMNGLHPHHVIRYLPSRYYLYGVYAAVLLHKADRAGAFRTEDQRQEIASLARNFIAVLKKAPSTESHVCHNYARMLKQLWDQWERQSSHSARGVDMAATDNATLDGGLRNPGLRIARHEETSNEAESQGSFDIPHFFGASSMADKTPLGVPSIENYLFGSFMPGVADFSTAGFDINLDQEYQLVGGLQDWSVNRSEIIPQ